MMNSTSLFNPHFQVSKNHKMPKIQATLISHNHDESNSTLNLRRNIITTVLASAAASTVALVPKPAVAEPEKWGTRSFIIEKYFSPSLSPEDAASRIRQTAEGLHSLREMLEAMSWKYVLYYLRQKQDYLNRDMKNAITVVPKGQWKGYISAANELVMNMNELDEYVRSPKVYESYLYYEKSLKAIDELVTFLP